MRVSKLFARTLREDPAEADVPSHRLLLRAAFIRKVAAGIYTTMPLGLRTMAKIERVVREEMDAAGSQELRMPIVLPAEPWKADGPLGRLRRRDLPHRGPPRPRVPARADAGGGRRPPRRSRSSRRIETCRPTCTRWSGSTGTSSARATGLLRGREFLMKDAYSLDRDEDGMRESYRVMYEAYERVFDRLGLDYVIVEADPGHDRRWREPRVHGARRRRGGPLRTVRERRLPRRHRSRHAAPTRADGTEDLEPLTEVDTPGAVTIELMVEQMGVPAESTMKCILFDVEGRAVAVLVPGRPRGGREEARSPALPRARAALRG